MKPLAMHGIHLKAVTSSKCLVSCVKCLVSNKNISFKKTIEKLESENICSFGLSYATVI